MNGNDALERDVVEVNLIPNASPVTKPPLSRQETRSASTSDPMTSDHSIPQHVIEALMERAGPDTALLNRMMLRLRAGDPIGYVLGYQDFMGRRYLADRRAYVAQADTAPFMDMVTEQCLALFSANGPLTVCEVGTGSGVHALHVAQLMNQAGQEVVRKLIATDIDDGALRLAKENVMRFQMDHKVILLESDLLAEVGEDESVDLVFAYPPWGRRSPGDLSYPGSEWEVFHQVMPPISCYPVGGDYAVHEGLLSQAADRFPNAVVMIFNDHLPLEDVQKLAAKHRAEIASCGEGMTALFRRPL